MHDATDTGDGFIHRWRNIHCGFNGHEGKAADARCEEYVRREGFKAFKECCTCAHARVLTREELAAKHEREAD